MLRRSIFFAFALVLGIGALAAGGRLGAATRSVPQISGNYLETRTCDVYTGPCFANAQVGLTGQQAIMAWNIEEGSHEGVDLAGLNVVLVVRAADTLGYGGGVVVHPDPIKSVVIVDERATDEQRQAIDTYIKQLADTKTFARPIVTEVSRLRAFYPAEGYHQHYAMLHPDSPYIYTYDLPKVAALKERFPSLYREDVSVK